MRAQFPGTRKKRVNVVAKAISKHHVGRMTAPEKKGLRVGNIGCWRPELIGSATTVKRGKKNTKEWACTEGRQLQGRAGRFKILPERSGRGGGSERSYRGIRSMKLN